MTKRVTTTFEYDVAKVLTSDSHVNKCVHLATHRIQAYLNTDEDEVEEVNNQQLPAIDDCPSHWASIAQTILGSDKYCDYITVSVLKADEQVD